ncbi:MAG TPA: pseudouridine synthase [Clostridia bacterium]|nr:pseudouridine synthase [Clostridia bacterium]
MRIHKVLSDNGILSRRKAEQLIQEGRITVNGRKAELGQSINPAQDIIHIDGEQVAFEKRAKKLYIMLNKPRGYVTTLSDELGRRCVAELISDVSTRVYPVGRLDKDSEGVLLLTNDGDFANLIMHPSHHISKTYRVTVRPDITEEQLVQLSTGVTLDDGATTLPAQVQVEVKETGRVVLRITIYEGKNRQIRRMCEALGLEVARLRRISVGPVKLGMLQPGKWRELTPVEVGALRGAVTILNPNSSNEPQKDRHRGRAFARPRPATSRTDTKSPRRG